MTPVSTAKVERDNFQTGRSFSNFLIYFHRLHWTYIPIKIMISWMRSCTVLLLVSVSVEGYLKMIQRNLPKKNETYFLETTVNFTFHEAQASCEQLGGHLPILNTLDDRKFMVDVVFNAAIGLHTGYLPWLGLLKENSQCSHWIDGSTVNIPFQYDQGKSCDSCRDSCCAMYMRKTGAVGVFWCGNPDFSALVCVAGSDSYNYTAVGKKLREVEANLKQLKEDSHDSNTNSNRRIDKTEEEVAKLQAKISDYSGKTDAAFAKINLRITDQKQSIQYLKSVFADSNKKLMKTNENLDLIMDRVETLESMLYDDAPIVQNISNLNVQTKQRENEIQDLTVAFEHLQTDSRTHLNETEQKMKRLETWISDHINNYTNIMSRIQETKKEGESLKKTLSISNIIQITVFVIMTCLIVTVGVLTYRARRGSVYFPQQNSLVNFANDDRQL